MARSVVTQRAGAAGKLADKAVDNLFTGLGTGREVRDVSNSNALDVAAYILDRRPGGLTSMELQKLVYYSQAWSLAWDGKPLFSDEIEAWQNGPVIPRLWNLTRKKYWVRKIDRGSSAALSQAQQRNIDAVLEYYGQFTAQQLSDMTHNEGPWADAWASRAHDGDWSDEPVQQQVMRRYYSVQAMMGESGPKRSGAVVSEASLGEALEAADRQISKWRSTLDWLAVR